MGWEQEKEVRKEEGVGVARKRKIIVGGRGALHKGAPHHAAGPSPSASTL